MPAPITGQSGALSSTPVQLDAANAAASCKAWILTAPLTNAKPVFVGPSGVSGTTGYQLDPGKDFSYERLSQNGQPDYELRPTDFWAVGTSPDIVTWLASP